MDRRWFGVEKSCLPRICGALWGRVGNGGERGRGRSDDTSVLGDGGTVGGDTPARVLGEEDRDTIVAPSPPRP